MGEGLLAEVLGKKIEFIPGHFKKKKKIQIKLINFFNKLICLKINFFASFRDLRLPVSCKNQYKDPIKDPF